MNRRQAEEKIDELERAKNYPKEYAKEQQEKDRAESIVVRRIEERGLEADPFHGGCNEF